MTKSERKKNKQKKDKTAEYFDEELEKAKREANLPSIFQLFMFLDPVHKKKRSLKRHKKPQAEADFTGHVESILKLIMVTQRNHDSSSWAKILYDHMSEASSEGKFIHFLSASNISHIESVLNDYILINSHEELDPLQHKLVEMTTELLHFLQQHSVDPFSCLVGLVASKEIVEYTKSDKEIGLIADSEQQGTRADILQQIMAWAVIDDPEQLQREVRAFAGQLRGVKQLNPGSLVLFEECKDKYVFARYPGGCEGNVVDIYLDPREAKLSKQRLDAIYPLKPSIVQRIQAASISDMEKMVQLPTDVLYQNMMRLTETLTYEYFQKTLHIDVEVVKRANLNQCSITELQKLTDARSKIKEIGIPEELLSSIENILREQKEELQRESTAKQSMFKPTKVENLRQLHEFGALPLVKMNMTRYLGVCESGLDQLQLLKRELMNGERKDRISAWWLQEIDKEVTEYLQGIGYFHDAVPENYVEQPPEDIEKVKWNIKILSLMLDAGDQSTGLNSLIKRLQDLIYPEIDSFVQDAKIVLSEQFNMDLTGKDFSLSQVEATFQAEQNSIDPQIREWISDMIKDIHYLNEMHKLEDPEYAKGLGTDVSLHIVPISGLVVGMIYRLQNECNTVCELWECEELSDSVEAASNEEILLHPGSIHELVVHGDIESVFQIIKETPEAINEQDESQRTAIHVLAQKHTQTHLEILEKVISLSSVDVNIQDATGNLALHYLVQYPAEEESQSELLQRVVRKITQGIRDINTKNNAGETCLHTACTQDNATIVKLLIASGTNVMEKNSEGEPCIFIAVRAGNESVVQALLDFAVDPLTSANGVTTIDVARELNNSRMIKMLSPRKEAHHPISRDAKAASVGNLGNMKRDDVSPRKRFQTKLTPMSSINFANSVTEAPGRRLNDQGNWTSKKKTKTLLKK